jgi:drug/metabolite transporter (DMT)-like permease
MIDLAFQIPPPYNEGRILPNGREDTEEKANMIDLILAICSSTAISLIMRLSSNKIKNNVSMLAVSYLASVLLGAVFSGVGNLLPNDPRLPWVAALGLFSGLIYLAGFLAFQASIRKNGMVLSSLFMKLGLLVPMVLSVFLFGEIPGSTQIAGFVLALGAIVLMNLQKDTSRTGSALGLLGVLLLGGSADAMSKVFEELGPQNLSQQFLMYTFFSAFLLSLAAVFYKKQRFGIWECLFGFLIGIPNFFSSRFLLGALTQLDAVIVYPTYSVATILAITLAGIFLFREKLTRQQWIGLGIIIPAIALLNL